MTPSHTIIIADRVQIVNHYSTGKSGKLFVTRKKSKSNQKKPPLQKMQERKKQSITIANKLFAIGEKGRAARMRACNTSIVLYRCGHCGKEKVANANLCRDRLCPVCQYLISVKRYNEMTAVLKQIGEIEQYDWRFITLTIKNCAPEGLATTIAAMLKAWDKVCKRRTVKAAFAGWARKIEITYNRQRGEFHPHIHVLAAFNSGEAPNMAAVRDWWRSALDLAYTPICDIKEPYSKSEKEALTGAIIEAFKYTVKMGQVEEMPLTAFAQLAGAIRGRKLIAYGGIIREARKALGYTDTEKPDQEVSEMPECCGAAMAELVLEWSFTGEEYRTINRTQGIIIDPEQGEE